jgi:hypothetical protein
MEAVTPQAGTWSLVEIPLTVHSSREVYSIDFINNPAGAQPTFYLDEIVFASSSAPPPPPPTPPDLSIDAAVDVHPISPYIYGMNFASTEVATTVRLPLRRRGGNSATRFNWQFDVHNTGSDWYFENIPDAPGTINNTVNQDLNTGSKTILTIPH